MSDKDMERLREFVREAVSAGLREHLCRFGEEQAAVLHEAAKRLTPDDVIVVAWLARRLQGAADVAGKWFARLVLAGLVTLLLLGAAGLVYAVRRGWLSP